MLGDITWNQKQIGISKYYSVKVPQTHLNSLFVFFPIQQWTCHNNIVVDKGLNLFDECAAECIYLYQKQIGISKYYSVKVPQTHLNSLFVFFPIQQWTCHNNIVVDKGLNLFDECAAECIYLCPQEEE